MSPLHPSKPPTNPAINRDGSKLALCLAPYFDEALADARRVTFPNFHEPVFTLWLNDRIRQNGWPTAGLEWKVMPTLCLLTVPIGISLIERRVHLRKPLQDFRTKGTF